MTYYADPEIWRYKYHKACRAYAAGELRCNTFLATLYSLGFRGRELITEERLHWTKKSIT